MSVKLTPFVLRTAVEQACQGSQKAFSALLNQYWGEVYYYQLKQTQNEYDAEDICMQTFAQAFDKIHTYKSEYAFNTWLLTIAKNMHIDWLRKRKNSAFEPAVTEREQSARQLADESPTAEDELITQQNLAALLAELKKLKPHYQEAIQYRFFQEMSYQDMAESLGIEVNLAKVRVLRAKQLLADLLKTRP